MPLPPMTEPAERPKGFTRTLVRNGDRVLISSECARCRVVLVGNADELQAKELLHRESCGKSRRQQPPSKK